jgi:Calcineurin-like phosphoesterase
VAGAERRDNKERHMAHRRARLLITCTALSVAATALMGVGSARAADSSHCDSFNGDLFQAVNPQRHTNLLSRSASEIAGAARFGFTENRGVLARVAENAEAGLTPVYRMYKSGDFVWAAEGTDVSDLIGDGYARQFVEFFAATNQVDCLTAVLRLERDGVHRMAAAGEVDQLVGDGWRREKTAFYAAVDTDTEPPPPPPPPPPPSGDTKFSIAIIPDTQNEVVNAGDTRMRNRSVWLANNKASLDLRYAMHIGDLVNWGHVVPAQFDKASAEMRPLEAAVPWAGAVGNHDTAAVCVGGSACPGANTSVTVRNTTAFNRSFPVSRFGNVKGTYEPNKIDNAYATFRAGDVDWIALTLELWPRAGAVAWANEVVRTHPNHNVVVVTHAYLNGDGSIGGSNGGYGATSPQYLYDNLIKVHPNIKLVLSGHTGQAAARIDTGTNGNKVLSLLQTYHSPNTNPVRLVEIDTAAGTVTSRVYAPLTNTTYAGDATSTTGMRFVK